MNEIETVRHRNKLLEEDVKHKGNKFMEQNVTIQKLEHELTIEREKIESFTKRMVQFDEVCS